MTHGWGDPFGPPPPGYPAPQPPPPQESTTLATLSVVFAFVFAPVGAVLGHLALTQTKGRDPHNRALVGLSVSYTVIVVAVIAVVVLAVTDHQPSSATTAATSSTTPATTSPRTTTPTTPTTTTITTTTTTPTVAPADLPNLLLSLDEIKAIMGINDMATFKTSTELEAEDGTYDPAECESAVTIGGVRTYEGSGYRSYHLQHHAETQMYNPQAAEAAATFDTAAAAQNFLAKLVGQWRSCAGKHVTASGYGWYDVGDLVQAGAVSLVRNVANDGNRTGVEVRALAAKANVVVEVFTYANTPNTEAPLNEQAATITSRILDRIPS